jgi:prepilin-type N-terminal cleavage/methylation domain-containing protein
MNDKVRLDLQPFSRDAVFNNRQSAISNPLSGFSLLELIGVLAIIAVLAAALFPVLIRRIDLATKKQETANLMVVSNALVSAALHGGGVPTVAQWTNSVATWSMMPASSTVANSRRYNRFYFTESLASSAANGVTYFPTNQRAVVVSTLGGDAIDPSTLPDPRGGALSATEFEALWATRDGSRPASGMFSTLNVNGDDFLVQRVDYAPLFHRLTLVNRDTNSASFRIEQGSTNSLVNSGGSPNVTWQAYYLDGAMLTLGDDAGRPMAQMLLTRDMGFVFEGGFWRDQIMGLSSGNSLPDDFAQKAQAFLEAPWNTNAKQGGGNTSDQQSVLTAMYTFMYTYTLWANQRPHFPWHGVGGTAGTQVPEFEMLCDVANDNAFLDNLTKYLVDN